MVLSYLLQQSIGIESHDLYRATYLPTYRATYLLLDFLCLLKLFPLQLGEADERA